MDEEKSSYMKKPSINLQEQKELNSISLRCDNDVIQFDFIYEPTNANDTKNETFENSVTHNTHNSSNYYQENACLKIQNTEYNEKYPFQDHMLKVEDDYEDEEDDEDMEDHEDLNEEDDKEKEEEQTYQSQQKKQSIKDSLSVQSKWNRPQAQDQYTDQRSQSQNLPQKKDIYYYIKLFMNIKLLFRLLTRNVCIYENLTKHQHALINDKSSVYKQEGQQKLDRKAYFRFLTRNIQTINKYNIKIPIFIPYHFIKRLWDVFIALLIMIINFLFNLVIFFDLNITQMRPLLRVSLFIFIIDIFVTLNTGIFKSNGDVLLKRKLIAKHYLQKEFIADQFGLAPLFFFCFGYDSIPSFSRIFYLAFLLKFIQLKNIFSRINFYLCYYQNKKNSLDLIKLILVVVSICHVFSLFWHGIAQYEISQGNTNTWLNKMDLEDQSVYQRYVYSFYFLSSTMLTVGYGDITPQNTTEVIFTIITMFTTGCVYSFILNTIGGIINNIERKEQYYQENMLVIHRLMRNENINQELRIKISNFFDYQYKKSNVVERMQQNTVIQKLSEQLKNELLLQIQGKYLKQIPILKNMIEQQKISLCMEECQFAPGEYIYKQGDHDDSAIYFIVRGLVNIAFFSNIQNVNLVTLGNNDYFGEFSFITGKERQLSAKAHDFCRLYKIKRKEFLSVIKDNSQDYENFKMIEDQISVYSDYKLSKMRCSACGQSNHAIFNCPKVHYSYSKQVYFLRNCYSQPHSLRQSFERREKVPYNPKHNLSKCLEGVYEINDNNQYYSALNLLEKGIVTYTSNSDVDEDSLKEIDQYSSVGIDLLNSSKQRGVRNQSLFEEPCNNNNNNSKNEVNKSQNQKANITEGSSKLTEDDKTKSSQITSSDESESSQGQSQHSIENKIFDPSNASKKNSKSSKLDITQKSFISFVPSHKKLSESKDIQEIVQILDPQQRPFDQLIQLTSPDKQQIIGLSDQEVQPEEIKNQNNITSIKQHSHSNTSSGQKLRQKKNKTNEKKSSTILNPMKQTSILNDIMEKSSVSSLSNSRLDKSGGMIQNIVSEKETSSCNIIIPLLKRQISSQMKCNANVTSSNNIGSLLAQQLNQYSKDMSQQGISPALHHLPRRKNVINQEELNKAIQQHQVVNKYKNLKKNSIQMQQNIQNELQKVSQELQNFQMQNLGNIMNMFKNNKAIITNKPQQHLIDFDLEGNLGNRNVSSQKHYLKDQQDYELLQHFECFKNYKYFYPHNNFQEVIKLWNKYSYEYRRKNYIKRKQSIKASNKFYSNKKKKFIA